MRGVKIEFVRDLSKDMDGLKPNMLFKSSHLGDISDRSLTNLKNRYNVRTIIDLRTDEEVSLTKDRYVKGQEYFHCPLLTNEDNPAITKKTRLNILKQRMKYPGGMKAFINDIYPKIVDGKLAIENFKKIFKLLLTKDGAFVYHCSQGKDRTGMLTSLILFSLGYDKETVKKNYLNYNKHQFKRNFLLFTLIGVLLVHPKYAKELNYALTANELYFETGYNTIVDKYGSVQNYLEKAIGLSKKDFETLKSKFLLSK